MACSCCSTESTPTKAPCPGCGQQGDAVSHSTLLHQLRTPWQQSLDEEAHYFCSSPQCDTVYFNTSGRQYMRDEVRQEVGQKSTNPERLLCYCFDIRYSDLGDADSVRLCREFVIEKTREKQCVCEQRNPSGSCCLRDFPKMEKST